jgi:hypothetical protein
MNPASPRTFQGAAHKSQKPAIRISHDQAFLQAIGIQREIALKIFV